MWRGPVTVAILALGAAVAQSFGRFAFGALLPAIRDDLGFSNTIAGSLGTVNVGAYLVGSLAVAMLSGRWRLLPVLRLGVVLATAGLVLALIAPSPWVLAVAMFASGFGGALVWIPSPAIAAAALSPERRNIAVAVLGSGIGFGILFVGQLGAVLRNGDGAADDSWRTAYLVMAVIAAGVLLATYTVVRHAQQRPAGPTSIGGFAELRMMPGWLPLTAAYTVFGLMYLLVVAFLSSRLEDDNGWTSDDASLAFTVLGVAVMFGGPLFILLGTRIGPRWALTIAFGLWMVVTLLVLPGWYVPTLVGSAAIGLTFAGVPTMITLYVVSNTTTETYGPSFAAATLAFGVAQMLSPQIGGLLADLTGSFLTVFLLSSALAVVGAAASLRLPRGV
ncbi:MAG: MFS transporter [Actinomycetota bacterium]